MDGIRRVRRRRRQGLSPSPLASTDAGLLAVLEQTFEVAAGRAGEWLVCGAGCSDCCHGPFPITRLDINRLQSGLAQAAASDPQRAARVRARAEETVHKLRDGYPGDAQTGRLAADEATLDRFFEKHAALPCPVLDPETGQCDLYASRPIACRTYGPPLLHGDRAAPHCPLCFQGASSEMIERCRIEPDPEGLETQLLEELGVQGGDEWDTLIAFAVQD